jgi:drug/metabolite transporter (DMT)-like permease
MTSWAILAISIFAAVYVELRLKTIECFPLFKHEIRWQYCNGIFIAIAGVILSSFPVHVFLFLLWKAMQSVKVENYQSRKKARISHENTKRDC